MDPEFLFLILGFVLLLSLGMVAAYFIWTKSEDYWVDESKPVLTSTGPPELINYTDIRSITRHKVDTSYNPRKNADDRDSAEIDSNKRERIRSVVDESLTHEKTTRAEAGTSRQLPWPSAEQQRNTKLEEQRTTRLRQLLRKTQTSTE